MTATIDNWTGPGSGGRTVAPNTFWWHADSTAQTVSFQVQFFNAAGALVTVNATQEVWDVTANASAFSNTGTGVNTLNIGPVSMTSGHNYAFAITYNGGTSCDHCICSVTGMGASTSGHPVMFIRRSGAWVGVPGHLLRIRRGGAWAILNNGFRIRRSGAWVQP